MKLTVTGICITILLIFCPAGANEWLYPVGQFCDAQGKTKLLLLYQKQLAHIELFEWDPVTGKADKALLSRYTPLGVTVIPGTSAFSFIDNGRIRIKQANKRSAKAFDNGVPLHNIGVVTWASSSTGFFTAQEQENHALYCCSTRGQVTQLMGSPGVDYMHPSCVGNSLFYITRSVADNDSLKNPPRCPKHAHCRCRPLDPVDAFVYSIKMIPLDGVDVVGHERQKQDVERAQVRDHAEIMVVDGGPRPLVFLKMVSETEGFVLEHAAFFEKDDAVITMRCHRFYKQETGHWDLNYLFSFGIPSSLVFPRSSDRLCEGFLPFVPAYDAGRIYFVDCSRFSSDILGLYSYNVATSQVQTVVNPILGSAPCASFPVGDCLFYGGLLSDLDNQPTANAPRMEIDENKLCIKMPYISIQSTNKQ